MKVAIEGFDATLASWILFGSLGALAVLLLLGLLFKSQFKAHETLAGATVVALLVAGLGAGSIGAAGITQVREKAGAQLQTALEQEIGIPVELEESASLRRWMNFDSPKFEITFTDKDGAVQTRTIEGERLSSEGFGGLGRATFNFYLLEQQGSPERLPLSLENLSAVS